MTDLAKTPKSAIFGDLAKGGPRENGRKSRPNSGARKSPWRNPRYRIISMRLKCNHWATFWRKRRFPKCPQSRAMTDLAKTPKSAIFGDLAKGGPRENGRKSRPTSGARKSPWRNPRYRIISMGLKCNHWATFWRKRRFPKCPQSRAMTDLAKTPKSAIFGDLAKGGPRENGRKSRPTSGARKSPCRNPRYRIISMRLKCNHWATFWRKRRFPKCPQSRAMTDLAKTPKSAIFGDLAKGGPRENGRKSRPTSGAQKSPWRNPRYRIISMRLKCNHWATFWRKRRFPKCPQSRAMTDLAKTPKSAIFGDLAKGGPRENGRKSRPTSGARKSPWRNPRYRIISMRLKCNHWATFWRKRRFPKCPQSRAMTDLAKTPKSAIFGDLAKGGPRENGRKSRRTSGAQKSPCRNPRYSIISMRLKCNHWATFWRKRRFPKCPQSRAMTDLAKTPKSGIFGDLAKGGPRENGRKSRPTSGARKSPCRNPRYRIISMRSKCNHWATFWRKRRFPKCPQSRAMTDLAKTPKSAIFGDLAKGGPRENGRKSRPTSGAQKSPWRNPRYRIISMRLKCNHWATFWRKRRFPKCPQSRAMTDLAKTPKSAIFGDLAKGGPRENGRKSRPTSGARKSPWRNPRYRIISMRLKCNHWATFWRKRRFPKCPQSRAMTDLAKTPKSAIFGDLAKGDQGKMAEKVGRLRGLENHPVGIQAIA